MFWYDQPEKKKQTFWNFDFFFFVQIVFQKISCFFKPRDYLRAIFFVPVCDIRCSKKEKAPCRVQWSSFLLWTSKELWWHNVQKKSCFYWRTQKITSSQKNKRKFLSFWFVPKCWSQGFFEKLKENSNELISTNSHPCKQLPIEKKKDSVLMHYRKWSKRH